MCRMRLAHGALAIVAISAILVPARGQSTGSPAAYFTQRPVAVEFSMGDSAARKKLKLDDAAALKALGASLTSDLVGQYPFLAAAPRAAIAANACYTLEVTVAEVGDGVKAPALYLAIWVAGPEAETDANEDSHFRYPLRPSDKYFDFVDSDTVTKLSEVRRKFQAGLNGKFEHDVLSRIPLAAEAYFLPSVAGDFESTPVLAMLPFSYSDLGLSKPERDEDIDLVFRIERTGKVGRKTKRYAGFADPYLFDETDRVEDLPSARDRGYPSDERGFFTCVYAADAPEKRIVFTGSTPTAVESAPVEDDSDLAIDVMPLEKLLKRAESMEAPDGYPCEVNSVSLWYFGHRGRATTQGTTKTPPNKIAKQGAGAPVQG